MIEGYFELAKEKKEKIDSFDVFHRRNPFSNWFFVFCGFNEIIYYINNLKLNEDDIEFVKKMEHLLIIFKFLYNFKLIGSRYAY